MLTAMQADEILVACEGVPALFSFRIGSSSPAVQSLALAGNALDVAFLERDQETRVAVVSVDHVHQAGSTTEIRHVEVSESGSKKIWHGKLTFR